MYTYLESPVEECSLFLSLSICPESVVNDLEAFVIQDILPVAVTVSATELRNIIFKIHYVAVDPTAHI